MAAGKRKDDRAGRRARARQARQEELAALHKLESARHDPEPLTRRIVQGVLDRFVPAAEAPRLLELGCGGGQLRRWLPRALAGGCVHLDVSPAFLRVLRQRHRDARAVRARAEALPVADGTLDAVVALCVLDALEAPARARDEIRRVLRPGGRLVHFLDLTTNLAGLFTSLVEEGLVPLPNFLGDLEGLPEPEPLDDLLVAPRAELTTIAGLLTHAGHALGPPLGEYLALFDPDGWDADETARAFVTLTSDRQLGPRLSLSLAQLYLTLQSPRWRETLPLSLRPLSSLRHFEERLRGWFDAPSGFQTELVGAVSVRDAAPRGAGPAGCRFLGFWAGTRARRARVPSQPAGTPLAEVTGDRGDDAPPTDAGAVVREAAVHVLVARKRPA